MIDKPIRPSAYAPHHAEGAKIRSVHTPLNELRLQAEVTHAELADRLGITTAAVAQTMRAANDPRISTIKKYVEALGGTLKIRAELEGEEVDLWV